MTLNRARDEPKMGRNYAYALGDLNAASSVTQTWAQPVDAAGILCVRC